MVIEKGVAQTTPFSSASGSLFDQKSYEQIVSDCFL